MEHKKSIRKYFSEKTEYWKTIYCDNPDNSRDFWWIQLNRRKNAVFEILDTYSAKASASVLEVGCGPGGMTESILNRLLDVFCLDISMPMIIKTKKMSEKYVPGGVPCFQGEIDDLPFTNNTFDVVICVGVLEYLESDDRAVKELSRVVKPGGIVIISLPNIMRVNIIFDPYYYIFRLPRYLWNIIWKKSPRTVSSVITKDFGKNTDFSDRRFFYNQLLGKFKSCDLVKVSTCSIGFGPMTLWRKDILPLDWTEIINNFLEKLTKKASFLPIGIFANRWIFCFQKKK